MRRTFFSNCSGMTLLLFAVMPALAHAQAYERIAPHQPPSLPTPPLNMPPATPVPAGGSQRVLLPALKGLVFLDKSQSLVPNGVPDSQIGIHQQGLPALSTPDFTHEITGFLGRPLTLAGLNEIVIATENWYRAHGYPFLAVNIPPQNISNGIVQVVVTQYKIGDVRVTGNRWFSSNLIKRESDLASGQTLSLAKVKTDMNWLNTNDFRTVNAVFSPGATQGTTDITLETKDRLPLYVYGTYDNQGTPNLGRGEWGVGAVWGNAFGRDQTLSYQFTRSVTGQYNAHSLNWTIPLPWRDKLLVFGSYSMERPAIDTPDDDFSETGHSGQASIRYVHSLPVIELGPHMSLNTDLQIGYDFKTSNNNLEFGGVNVFNSKAEVDQFPIIFNATETDRHGQTSFQNQLDLSPGNLTGANNTAAFKKLVPGSCASYYADQISLGRTVFLPGDFAWTGHVLGQFTNHNLVYSEQLALGGMSAVRGYDTDTALGSEGIIIQNEFRAPPVSLFELTGLKSAIIPRDTEQLGVFYDYGHVSQIQRIPDTVNGVDLASVGLDLHATVGPYVTVAWDLGWRLRNAPTDGGKDHAFGDVSLTVGF